MGPKYCMNYDFGEYEWIDEDGYSWDQGEYVYSWDDSAIIEMNATKRKTIGEIYEEIIIFIATHINGVNWMQFK